jgi:hypothetical protein
MVKKQGQMGNVRRGLQILGLHLEICDSYGPPIATNAGSSRFPLPRLPDLI